MSNPQKLLEVLARHRSVQVVTHDNPDPDAIASSWAIAELIASSLRIPCRVFAGGIITRAENRALIDLLSPPLELLSSIPDEPDTARVLVDTNPSLQNHLLARSPGSIHATIDHHEALSFFRVSFRDIRPSVASASTILVSYFRRLHRELPRPLATALCYGIQTDISGHSHFSRLDRQSLAHVTRRADLDLLRQITEAPRSRGYYGDLVQAIRSTLIYQDSALCILPELSSIELVSEAADLIIREESINRLLCAGRDSHAFVISTRTTEAGGNALALTREALDGIAYVGGHERRAGAKIPLPFAPEDTRHVGKTVPDLIRARWLATCQVDATQPESLAPQQ